MLNYLMETLVDQGTYKLNNNSYIHSMI